MDKIIVVEDNLAMCRLISIELSRNNFDAIYVNTGKDAIETSLKNPNVLMLLDYILPDLSCNEIIDRIKLQNPKLNFVIMSGRGNEKIAVEMMKKGALNYIPKNIDFIDILVPIIRKALQEVELKNDIQKIDSLYKDVEIKYQQIVDNTESLIISINEKGNIIFCNNRSSNLIGYLPEELLGKKISAIISQDYISLCESVLQDLTSGTKNIKYHTQYVHKNGNFIDVEVKASSVLNNEGKFSYLVAIIDDITDRKFEQELLINHSIISTKLNKISNLTEASQFLCKRILEINHIQAVCFLNKNNSSNEFEEYSNYNFTPKFSNSVLNIINKKSQLLENHNRSFYILNQEAKLSAKYNDIVIYEIKNNKKVVSIIFFKLNNIENFDTRVHREIDSFLQHVGGAISRIEAEHEALHNNLRIESLNRIYNEHFHSVEQLLNFAMNEAIKITKSKIGYIYRYSEKEQIFTNFAWSNDVMEKCEIMEKYTTYPLEKTGLWGEAIRQRKAIITNKFEKSNPHIKGVPKGHLKIERHANLPIFYKDEIVAVLGVGNKEIDYEKQDINQLKLLMDAVWNLVENIENEKQIQEFVESQVALKDIISLTLKNYSLQDFIDKVFQIFFTLKWLNVESKGAVFLHDIKSNKLKLLIKKGFKDELPCFKNGINIGQCLCGKAFYDKQIIIKSKLDSDHEIRTDFMTDHGHIIAPINDNKKTRGVLNLYLKQNAVPSQREISFIESVTDIISTYINKQHSSEKIISLSKNLMSKNNELNQLMSISTHELRAPLVNIEGFHNEINKTLNIDFCNLDTAQKNELKNKVNTYSFFIDTNLKKMRNMLKSIHDLHQLNVFETNLDAINMYDLIQKCIFQFQREIHAFDVEVQIQKIENIYADENLIFKVFCNLLENSIKYRKPDKKCVISIDSKIEQNKILYCFADNGIGISKTEMNKIFDLFYKNDLTIKGSGLGLPFVKKIIDLHNGKITIDSTLGNGTSICMQFPIVG